MITALLIALAPWVALGAPPPDAPGSPPTAAGPSPAVAPPAPPLEAPAPGTATPPKFDRVRLDVQELSAGRIAGAIEAKLPHVAVDERPIALGTRGVYVGVHTLPTGDIRVLAVLSNGRFFSRTIQPAGQDRDAEVAFAVAELLVAIESGQVVADEPSAAAVAAGVATPGAGAPPPPPLRVDTGWRLGFGLAPEVALGVYPSGVGGVLTGGGGSLELRARAPKGALILAGGRFMGNRGAGVSLGRARAHLIAGYSWRPKKAEIDLGAGGTFEAWWVRIDGASAEPARGDQNGAPPLVGALLRLAAARLFDVGKADVRIGGRLEIAGSAAPDGGIRVPGVVKLGPVHPEDAFRLGGVEIMLGLDFAATWPIFRRAAAATLPTP